MVAAPVEAVYGDYLKTTDSPGFPISLELALFMAQFLEKFRPATILDLGSGFSSWLFRQYAAVVLSVDDDRHYLEKAARFCGVMAPGPRLEPFGFYLWDESVASSKRMFDLVFVDYAGGEARNSIMQWAVDHVADGGAIIFDDMQWQPHRDAAVAALDRRGGFIKVGVTAETMSPEGRCALLAVRNKDFQMTQTPETPSPVDSALDRALAKVHQLEDELDRVSERLQSARAEAHQARVAGQIETR